GVDQECRGVRVEFDDLWERIESAARVALQATGAADPNGDLFTRDNRLLAAVERLYDGSLLDLSLEKDCLDDVPTLEENTRNRRTRRANRVGNRGDERGVRICPTGIDRLRRLDSERHVLLVNL